MIAPVSRSYVHSSFSSIVGISGLATRVALPTLSTIGVFLIAVDPTSARFGGGIVPFCMLRTVPTLPHALFERHMDLLFKGNQGAP